MTVREEKLGWVLIGLTTVNAILEGINKGIERGKINVGGKTYQE